MNDRHLEIAIQRIRPFNIKTAILIQSDEFDMTIKLLILLTAFFLGMQVSV